MAEARHHRSGGRRNALQRGERASPSTAAAAGGARRGRADRHLHQRSHDGARRREDRRRPHSCAALQAAPPKAPEADARRRPAISAAAGMYTSSTPPAPPTTCCTSGRRAISCGHSPGRFPGAPISSGSISGDTVRLASFIGESNGDSLNYRFSASSRVTACPARWRWASISTPPGPPNATPSEGTHETLLLVLAAGAAFAQTDYDLLLRNGSRDRRPKTRTQRGARRGHQGWQDPPPWLRASIPRAPSRRSMSPASTSPPAWWTYTSTSTRDPQGLLRQRRLERLSDASPCATAVYTVADAGSAGWRTPSRISRTASSIAPGPACSLS